jgi:hypothetical protein
LWTIIECSSLDLPRYVANIVLGHLLAFFNLISIMSGGKAWQREKNTQEDEDDSV